MYVYSGKLLSMPINQWLFLYSYVCSHGSMFSSKVFGVFSLYVHSCAFFRGTYFNYNITPLCVSAHLSTLEQTQLQIETTFIKMSKSIISLSVQLVTRTITRPSVGWYLHLSPVGGRGTFGSWRCRGLPVKIRWLVFTGAQTQNVYHNQDF